MINRFSPCWAVVLLMGSLVSPLAAQGDETLPLKAVSNQGFKPSGLLRERMQLNFDRMDSARFAPIELSGCLREKGYAWPGDMEGRALLAFVRLERATGRPSANLAALRQVWPSRLNCDGYFGAVLDPQAIDEQQLSGHGWVLRGLCELYDWRHDPAVLEEIRVIVKHLALPTLGAHASYPIAPGDRVKNKGSYAGEHAQSIGRWVLSTDIGCDLIFMDGLMQAAILLQDPATDALCEEILARNLQIDLAGIQAQTHATLTGLRGMLRWAAYRDRPELVDEAEKRFQLYLREAMSENCENWNWFGRPTHTEPCAVVDSFMVANELWRLTRKAEYLAAAHRIAYNGFFAEQNANGGFGCSTVSGANGVRHVGIAIPEAWWCCSMRGAEGFAELAEHSLCTDESGVYFTGLNSGRMNVPLAGGRLVATLLGNYPFAGRLKLEVEAAPKAPFELHFFTPPWAANPAVMLNGKTAASHTADGFTTVTMELKPGDSLAYDFQQAIHCEPTSNRHSSPGYVTYNYGPLILALDVGAPEMPHLPPPAAWRWDPLGHCAVAPGSHAVLTPLGERFERPDPNPKSYARQLLFGGETPSGKPKSKTK